MTGLQQLHLGPIVFVVDLFVSDRIFASTSHSRQIFLTLNPVNGKISGESARSHMIKSQLPSSTLRKIWILGDVDRDGCLDDEEFALVCHLIKLQLDGEDLPSVLPAHLVPPSKRNSGTEAVENGHELRY